MTQASSARADAATRGSTASRTIAANATSALGIFHPLHWCLARMLHCGRHLLESFMGQFSIGQSVRRREDPRLLMGRGRFFDDLKLADQFHAAILRSPHAHADIKTIDARAALQMPGVHAVLTGKDYAADGLGTMPSMAPYKRRDGGPMVLPHRPAIAVGRVMHVGYPVAVVVADTLEIARDAAERVEVDYAPR